MMLRKADYEVLIRTARYNGINGPNRFIHDELRHLENLRPEISEDPDLLAKCDEAIAAVRAEIKDRRDRQGLNV